MAFKDWIKNSETGIEDALKEQTGKSKIIDTNRGHNLLLPYYIQYEIFKWTKWLVFGTWALVIATILLVIFKG